MLTGIKGRRGGSDRAEVRRRRRDVRRGGRDVFEEQRHQSARPDSVQPPPAPESSGAAASIAKDVKLMRSLFRLTPPASLVSVLVGTGFGGNHGSRFGTSQNSR